MRFFESCGRRLIWAASFACVTVFLAGCVTNTGQPPAGPTPPVSDPNALLNIPLQSGDSIEVDLTGTPETIPPSTSLLSGAGTISLPHLPTNVVAIGRTPHQLESDIHDLYINDGIYTSINVTVTPGPRYYYVGGEVNQTGNSKQLYTGRVTVLSAITAAGGFNNFAARTRVQLTRQDGKIFLLNCKKALKDPSLDLEVFPGDRVFVDKQTPLEAVLGQ
jgi:protein involved in polysaccharide export with SLBB domain